mmetsp:Transcript_10922/g.26225  ORF Transcript_10922/g.26225 Transcript_10922/m.26225 type:complete len:237 (-) Transcript_10922:83-793(-)
MAISSASRGSERSWYSCSAFRPSRGLALNCSAAFSTFVLVAFAVRARALRRDGVVRSPSVVVGGGGRSLLPSSVASAAASSSARESATEPCIRASCACNARRATGGRALAAAVHRPCDSLASTSMRLMLQSYSKKSRAAIDGIERSCSRCSRKISICEGKSTIDAAGGAGGTVGGGAVRNLTWTRTSSVSCCAVPSTPRYAKSCEMHLSTSDSSSKPISIVPFGEVGTDSMFEMRA